MQIVITGANGFLGAELLARNRVKAEFISIGRKASQHAVRHVEADLSHPDQLAAAVRNGELPAKVDLVMHLAVSRHHRTFPETALDMFNVNVASTALLLDYARQAGARQFILGSTGTVYHPFPKSPLTEEDTSVPGSYFGWSKLAAEQAAQLYAPQCFTLFVPRFFVPYGPHQTDRMVDGLISRIRNGLPVTLPLEGSGLVSSPIYLDDAVAVLERAIMEGWEGRLNVAGGEALSLSEMASTIGEALGREPVWERAASGSAAVLVPDLAKLRRLMNVDAFMSFRDGIRQIVATG